MSVPHIIDSDGHVFEDLTALARFFPPPYNALGPFRKTLVIPPIDHLHVHKGEEPPGAFDFSVGPLEWLAFLDEVGIATTVLYPSEFLAYGRIMDPDWAIIATQAYNDWLHDTYLRQSSRFRGMALIPLQEPAAAVAELRRAVEELGMLGAMLPATGLKSHLGSKEYWPVYQEADRLGCCLAVHGGCHSGLGLDTMNVFPVVHALGHPLSIMISFSGIIANGIFDKFPNVRIAFLEGGVGWIVPIMERLTESFQAFRPYNPRGELVMLKDETLADYILRQISDGRIFIGCEGGEQPLAQCVKLVGDSCFLYSSDFPHEVNGATCKHEIAELLENEELTPEDKDAILYRNAERFYNLAPEFASPAASR